MLIQPHDRILFQGDSITHAFRKPEEVGSSYRLGAGWVMMVAARLHAEYPDWDLQIENRGECGHTVAMLIERWDRDCLALQPTVLNVLAGVNDVIRTFKYGTGMAHDEFHATYRDLLDRTRAALPDTRLILCEPFLLEAGLVNADWLVDLRGRREIVRDLASEFGAVFVPLQERFEAAAASTGAAYWLFDGIHPHASGQWLIMQAWLQAVGMV